jgi:hypothetical protein
LLVHGSKRNGLRHEQKLHDVKVELHGDKESSQICSGELLVGVRAGQLQNAELFLMTQSLLPDY